MGVYTINYSYRSQSQPNSYLLVMHNYENSVILEIERIGDEARVLEETSYDNDGVQLEDGLWLDYTTGDDWQQIENYNVPLTVQHVALTNLRN